MLPLVPPLSRGARPGCMNSDRPSGSAEKVALYRDPGSQAAQARFARHLVERDPENVWALMILAGEARIAVERMALLSRRCASGCAGGRPISPADCQLRTGAAIGTRLRSWPACSRTGRA